ncbi:hypothetical protein PIB30_052862 [Stylosanthes scabra]|uniref:Uncharacterized protein n=1 Tax=Stylosanthes scabra TaxID=79078 RepID=A0ABU6VGT6_9FABA|nr:hypothetical protein [Stylosanthes scabra]
MSSLPLVYTSSPLTSPPLLSSISHRRPLPPRVTTPPWCLGKATHSHHHSSLSISSITAAIHKPPRRSLNRVVHHHLQKPPNTAAIFPLSQLRQPPTEPLSSETHTPPTAVLTSVSTGEAIVAVHFRCLCHPCSTPLLGELPPTSPTSHCRHP